MSKELLDLLMENDWFKNMVSYITSRKFTIVSDTEAELELIRFKAKQSISIDSYCINDYINYLLGNIETSPNIISEDKNIFLSLYMSVYFNKFIYEFIDDYFVFVDDDDTYVVKRLSYIKTMGELYKSIFNLHCFIKTIKLNKDLSIGNIEILNTILYKHNKLISDINIFSTQESLLFSIINFYNHFFKDISYCLVLSGLDKEIFNLLGENCE